MLRRDFRDVAKDRLEPQRTELSRLVCEKRCDRGVGLLHRERRLKTGSFTAKVEPTGTRKQRNRSHSRNLLTTWDVSPRRSARRLPLYVELGADRHRRKWQSNATGIARNRLRRRRDADS